MQKGPRLSTKTTAFTLCQIDNLVMTLLQVDALEYIMRSYMSWQKRKQARWLGNFVPWQLIKVSIDGVVVCSASTECIK